MAPTVPIHSSHHSLPSPQSQVAWRYKRFSSLAVIQEFILFATGIALTNFVGEFQPRCRNSDWNFVRSHRNSSEHAVFIFWNLKSRKVFYLRSTSDFPVQPVRGMRIDEFFWNSEHGFGFVFKITSLHARRPFLSGQNGWNEGVQNGRGNSEIMHSALLKGASWDAFWVPSRGCFWTGNHKPSVVCFLSRSWRPRVFIQVYWAPLYPWSV